MPGPSLGPSKVRSRLVFGDAGLEEVLLFTQIDRLAHPGERILGFVERLKVNAL